MDSKLTPEKLSKKLSSANQLDPPDIREIEFDVRSMGHLPPQDFIALTATEVAAKPWINSRMITVEWNYHIPTRPDGTDETNLKNFLDRLKDVDGEQAVFDRCQALNIQYLGTHRIGFLSFDPAGPFKTIFAFSDDALLNLFLDLPTIPGTNSAAWQQLEAAVDRNFRLWIGRTSPLRITTYRPAIGWTSAQR